MDTVPMEPPGDFLANIHGARILPLMCMSGISILNQYLEPLKTSLPLHLDLFFNIFLLLRKPKLNTWSSPCSVDGKCHLAVTRLVYSSILKESDTKDVLRDWPPDATF